MSIRSIVLWIASSWLVLSVGLASDDWSRIALLMGNARYTHVQPLGNPPNDIAAMETALRRLDFEVISGIDLDLRGMQNKLIEFKARVRGEDNAIAMVFYAGHATEIDGRNYLLPIDGAFESKDDFKYRALDAQHILEEMDSLPAARAKILVLDACRDDPMTSRSIGLGSGEGGLSPMEAEGGTLIAFATAPGKTAGDGTGANSPFTSALLQQIARPGVDLLGLFNNVSFAVRDTTDGNQLPWTNSAALPPVFLAGRGAPVAAASDDKGVINVTGAENVRIFVDNLLVGSAPFWGLRQNPGDHTLRAEGPGGEWREDFRLLAGEVLDILVPSRIGVSQGPLEIDYTGDPNLRRSIEDLLRTSGFKVMGDPRSEYVRVTVSRSEVELMQKKMSYLDIKVDVLRDDGTVIISETLSSDARSSHSFEDARERAMARAAERLNGRAWRAKFAALN